MPLMTERPTAWVRALLPAALLSLALIGALFFDGDRLDVLCATLSLLVLGLAAALWWPDDSRTPTIPRVPLAAAVTLYGMWLGVTLLWHPVIAIGGVYFWWLASPVLAYWACLQLPDPERGWRFLAGVALVAGLMLAGQGAFQHWMQGAEPASLFADINLHAAFLNLVALPLTGYFLAHSAGDKPRRPIVLAMAASFLLIAYSVMLTQSRGAVLAHALALSVLSGIAWRHVPHRAVLIVLLLAFGAFAAANVAWDGGLVERLGTLARPHEASTERLLIWRSAWELLTASPWWGIGPGMFPLLWQAYRYPEDGSAGYFAHNDYLQIWIEAGLPGLLLLLAVLAASFWTCRAVLRRRAMPASVRLEAAGLGVGVGTVAVHAFFEFPLYSLPIIILSGLALGRLQRLALLPAAGVRFRLRLSPAGFRAIVAALVLLPLTYFASVGASAFALERGVALAARGELEQADAMFGRAQWLWPASDAVAVARADLYRQILAKLPPEPQQAREAIFRQAQEWLAQAERLNRWRALTYLMRAELYRANRDRVAGAGAEQAEEAYRQALAYNPRYYAARYSYARFLLGEGRPQEARRLLEEGMRYTYPNADPLLPYLLLTYQMRERAGELPQALELRTRIAYYVRLRGDKMTIDAATEANLAAMGLRPPRVATP